MADQKLFNSKFTADMKAMEISLSASVQRTTINLNEFIDRLTVAGSSQATIKTLLADDLRTGGRLFGEFKNSVKATTEGTIGSLSTDAYLSEFGVAKSFTWIAALVKTCVDCLPRHGNKASFASWEDQGLPRTGWSVCRSHCQCVLIPGEIASKSNKLSEPLTRKPRTRKK